MNRDVTREVHHHYFHDVDLAPVIDRLDALLRLARESRMREASIMATIEQVLTSVTEQTTMIGSIGAIVTGLKQQLADALANLNVPPAVQAKIDEVFAVAESNKAKLAEATVTNVPDAPPA